MEKAKKNILTVNNVTKHFGGLTALKDVNFVVQEGEVLGLMGPNGAGKTTLLNIIAGEYIPDSGDITFKNHNITKMKPHRICHLGIARTYQIPQPFVTLTVHENLLASKIFGRKLKKKEALAEEDKILDLVELNGKKDICAEDLSTLSLKRLEIGRALARKPDLLLLDEVAAGSTEAEIPKMLSMFREIHNSGITIIIIEHNMKVLMNIVDRLIVIDKGIKIAEGVPSAIMCDSKVIEAYFGA